MDKLLTPKELADILNVKPGTVFSWISRGIKLPPSIRIAGTTRWRLEVVQEWIKKKEKEKKQRNFED